MTHIPKELLDQILKDPFYKKCIRAGERQCKGRITFEHAIIYQGRQLNCLWSIVPVCSYHHCVDEWQDRGDFNKELHERAALNRAQDYQLQLISKAVDYIHRRNYLNEKYRT